MGTRQGIWKYADKFGSEVEREYRLSMGEGGTRVQEIDGLFFKREDENPTGSVKDRGMAFQISVLKQQGAKEAVISSSGNAGISAASYCNLADIKLTVFVSEKLSMAKLNRLESTGVNLVKSMRPVSDAHNFGLQNNIYNLRPSKSKYGSIGYQSIAYELGEQLPEGEIVLFTPMSSGVTLMGMKKGFDNIKRQVIYSPVQTSKVHPIAKLYDHHIELENQSVASAIVAKVVPNRKQLKGFINYAWAVTNIEIKNAYSWLAERGIETSFDSAVSLAGYFKALKNLSGKFFDTKNVVCLLTGSL